jgi:hypothetical protein
MCVRLHATYQLGSLWTGFRETRYWARVLKSFVKIQIRLASDKGIVHVTWTLLEYYVNKRIIAPQWQLSKYNVPFKETHTPQQQKENALLLLHAKTMTKSFTATRISETCQDNVPFHLNNISYTNAPQCYVTKAIPTLFKIQADTPPKPLAIKSISIRHLSRNDPFHSLSSRSLAS